MQLAEKVSQHLTHFKEGIFVYVPAQYHSNVSVVSSPGLPLDPLPKNKISAGISYDVSDVTGRREVHIHSTSRS